MPEIKIDEKFTEQKDKVFFPGVAVLSDKEAKSIEDAKSSEDAAVESADEPKADVEQEDEVVIDPRRKNR